MQRESGDKELEDIREFLNAYSHRCDRMVEICNAVEDPTAQCIIQFLEDGFEDVDARKKAIACQTASEYYLHQKPFRHWDELSPEEQADIERWAKKQGIDLDIGVPAPVSDSVAATVWEVKEDE